jgi:aspartate kinase
VRSSFNFTNGTYVTDEGTYMEDVVVTGVTYCRDEAKVTIGKVPDRPGIASLIFGGLAEKNIVVDMIIQNMSEDGYTDISFTVAKDDLERAIKAISGVAKNIGAQKVLSATNIAKVSIVGMGMRSHSGVAHRMFKTLADKNINIMMISTSEIKISCVIELEYVELAVRSLHKEFGLDKVNGAKNG